MLIGVAELGVRLFARALKPPIATDEANSEPAAWLPHDRGAACVWSGLPGSPREFRVASRWNSQGFNDRDHDVANPQRRWRIVVVGDSFVEALQVAQDRSFTRLLDDRLNQDGAGRYEVIALGRSGTGPRGYVDLLTRLGLAYGPDLVIFEFLPENDVRDDSEALTARVRSQVGRMRVNGMPYFRPRTYAPRAAWPAVLRESQLAALAGQAYLNARFRYQLRRLSAAERAPVDAGAYKRAYDPSDAVDREWIQAWRDTMDTIARARALTEATGARFLLVSFTDAFRTSDTDFRRFIDTYPALAAMQWDVERPERTLASFTAAAGIDFLALQPLFRAAYDRDHVPLHFQADGHWNEQGHRLAADSIYRHLRERQYVAISEGSR